MIGNSSSGLIEAPALGLKVINIGQRQKGRISPKEVINIKCKKKYIISSIKKNLNKKITYKNIYPAITSSKKIVKILENVDLSDSIKKNFLDLKKNL